MEGDNEQLTKANVNLEKLKYRIGILEKALTVVKERNFMANIKNMLEGVFGFTIFKLLPDCGLSVINIVTTTNPKFGDYQCNVALMLSKKYGCSPLELAKSIVEALPKDCPVIGKIQVAPPGFINIHVNDQFIVNEIQQVFKSGVKLPPILYKKKIIVDFSSPNIAKEMHVGHLRSTIIGDTLANLFELLGHDVLRINHVGDWGTQFGMLIAHLQDTFPDYLEKEDFVLPISDLQVFYKESKKRFDEDEEFKKRAYACVVKLQNKDSSYIKAWNLICDVSRREFAKIYDRLGIIITERGESFYQSRMIDLIKYLEEKEEIVEEDGRKMIFNDSGLPLTIIKSDGGFTYDTSDLTALRQRIEEEKADWVLYNVDSGQAAHFNAIFDSAKKIGILDDTKVRVNHVGFGVVLGEDGKKFKTRSGDTVRLTDLLNEGITRAGEKLLEKERDKTLSPEEFNLAKENLAYGCIKYADLSRSRLHDYVFSFDRMLDDKGNTAVYLIYAYTRIKSICRKAEVSIEKLAQYAKENPLNLSHEKEISLSKKLLKFPEVIEKVSDDLFPHSLCEFMYEIATSFSEFYDNCKCIEKDNEGIIIKIHYDRLILCEAAASILQIGFNILGIKPVSKM